MKKMLVLLMLSVITALAAGCSNNAAEEKVTEKGSAPKTEAGSEAKTETESKQTKADGENKEGVTLTFGLHQAAVASSGILQEVLKDFENETGIKVDLQIAPDGQWKDMLNVKLGANEAPDIFCTDTTPISLKSVVNPQENCIDLTDEEFAGRMSEESKACFTYDDRLYGMSIFGNKMWLYFYNKDMFEELGLKAPKTYEEFKNVCQVIKDSGVTPIFEATPSTWHQGLPLIESAGSYVNETEDLYGKLNRNEMKVKDIKGFNTIMNQLNEFSQLGFFGEDYLSNNIEEDMNYFAEGKVAMVLNTQGWGQMVQEQFPETKDNIGFFVMPWNDNQTLGVNPAGGGFFGYKKSEHQEEIKEFFRYFTRPEVLKKYHEGSQNSMEMPFEGIEPKYPKEYTDYFNSLDKQLVMQVGVTYIDPVWSAIGKDVEAMYAGMMTPEEVIDGIDQKRVETGVLQKDPAFAEK